MYQHYLGVDLHRRRSYVVLMDAQGNIGDQRRLPNDAILVPVWLMQAFLRIAMKIICQTMQECKIIRLFLCCGL